MRQLFRTKDIDALLRASAAPGKRLERTLGPVSLVALGVGAVIGSGIFVLTGTAAAGEVLSHSSVLNAPIWDLLIHGSQTHSIIGRPGAGPAIWLSFLLTAVACCFAALCYAELASMIPIAGSAYTYAYATLGEVFAWLLGWDLILEYAVSNMAVAVSFSAYLNDVLENLFGFAAPSVLSQPMIAGGELTGAWFNLPAFLVIMGLTWILARGVRESAGANNFMVMVKVAAIMLFVLGAARAVDPANWHPQMPNGFSGVITGAAIVFFTYIGFDSVSTAAEECRNPQRDIPVGILGTLLVCAALYVSVALVLTGIARWDTLNNAAPVANALKALGYDNLRMLVSIGAVTGMVSSLLVFQYGQARVWFAMSRDRLLPEVFSRVHPKRRTPVASTWIAGLFVGIPAGVWDVGTFADLSNIGTLFAFVMVAAGVLILRRTQPHRPRSFRVPLGPLFPMLAILCCLTLMFGLPLETWLRFFVWAAAGLAVYWFYGRKHSEFAG